MNRDTLSPTPEEGVTDVISDFSDGRQTHVGGMNMHSQVSERDEPYIYYRPVKCSW